MPPRSTSASDPSPRTISVTGTGQVRVSPDLVDLRLGVTVTAKTVAAARAANARAMSDVIASLKARGIAAADIQTANLSLSPAYDYSRDQSPPRLVGYTYANTVAVVIRDVALLGPAIDGATDAGATSLEGIAFRVEDPSGAEQRARKAAVADARAKADTLAAAAGVSIIGVAAITEVGGPVPYPVFRTEMAMAARDAATPIETGTNEVTVTVAASYLIG